MKLYGASASPFVAKVRMAGVLCGIPLDFVAVNTADEPEELLKANPLGKIPVLIDDDGTTIFDSVVICELFDRMSGNQIIPQTLEAYGRIKTFEAAVDGTLDALILTIYEERYRPEDKRHPGWVERQMRKADRGLLWLETHLDDLGAEPTVAHCALAGLCAWMDLRFAGKVAAEAPKLAEWAESFFAEKPELAEVRPAV